MLKRTANKRRRAPEAPSAPAVIKHAGLDDLIGHQVRMAYVAMARHFTSAMEPLDLTQKQVCVLWLIAANGGVSQIALATELGMDRASMMAIVDRLEERGLIVRKRSRSDGRRQELYVTATGRKVLAKAKSAMVGHEKWIASRFSARELTQFVAALRRMRSQS